MDPTNLLQRETGAQRIRGQPEVLSEGADGTPCHFFSGFSRYGAFFLYSPKFEGGPGVDMNFDLFLAKDKEEKSPKTHISMLVHKEPHIVGGPNDKDRKRTIRQNVTGAVGTT